MSNIEIRVLEIEERNQKVELDKAWETSWTRRLSISTLTYFVVLIYMIAIGNDRSYVNALVPSVGFLLSTLLLPWVKDIWQKMSK